MLLNPIQARSLFADALSRGYAILAVNADSPAAITDCLEAARLCDSPIILETSLWQLTGHSFGFGDPILGLARYIAQLSVLAQSKAYASIPVVFHTDHIKGPATFEILSAAIRGVPVRMGSQHVYLSASTVSLDSSELSAAENIDMVCRLAAEAVEACQPLTMEMEAGVDDGLTDDQTTNHLLSSVEQARPGTVWLWAPGLGTRHGFSEAGYPQFSVDAVQRQRRLARAATGREIGLALHGSSGLAEEALQAAAAAGVVKVNWSSESLLLRSRASAEFYRVNAERLNKSHKEFKPTAMDNGLQSFVSSRYVPALQERMGLLNSVNKAGGALRAIGPAMN